MLKYNSFMKSEIEKFIKYRIASQHWNEVTHGQNLKTFQNYCMKNFPKETSLTQEMVDSWCCQRKTEQNKSYRTRIEVVINFLKYTNDRNFTNLKIPEKPKVKGTTYKPHTFTEIELKNFFYACDNIEIKNESNVERYRKIAIPVFYRLLYSTGMRTTEARLLKRQDVDLQNKIIDIAQSKGYDQHYVPIHESLLELLIKYDEQVNEIYPNRKYFFTNSKNSFHKRDWVWKNFREMWYKYNENYARAYDFRHNYAIVNINSWLGQGIEFSSKLYYLSKSMGHKEIESTKYYYSLTPRIADIFKNQVNKEFENMIPEVKEYE